MKQVNARDVDIIKEWIEKEPHLPDDFDDIVIQKFLFSCDNSLERTKRCIEEFCCRRSTMPEVYCNRDPLSKRMQDVFAMTTVTTYAAGSDEILVHQLTAVPDHFDFYDCIKGFTIQSDHWLRQPADVLPLNHIVVIDLKYHTLKLIAKCNIFYLQKFIVFLLESMPVRLTQVHMINCPSYCDCFYNLVKPALPDYICNLVYFHPNYMGLHKYIDKKYLPEDFEGDAPSLAEHHANCVKEICEDRKPFLDDECWKADLSKKFKNTVEEDFLSGSFRTLAVD